MAFRSIGELAGDVMQRMEIAHTDTGAATNAPRSVAPQVGGGNPLRMGKKEGEATELNFAKLPLPWEVWTGNGVRKADMSMVTVTAATKGRRPSAPAVVIDMFAWKAQRRAALGLGEHQASPFTM